MNSLLIEPLTRKFWMSFRVSSTLLLMRLSAEFELFSTETSLPITGRMLMWVAR